MQKGFFKKGSIRKSITPIMVVLVIVFLFTAMYMKKKTIMVVVDGKQMKISTFRSTVGQVLKTNDISVGPKDKINFPLNSKLSKNQMIILKKAVNLKIAADGREISVLSSEENIDSMLKAEGIHLGKDDKITPSKETTLKEGMKIKIVRVEFKNISDVVPIHFKEVVKVNKSLPNTKRLVTHEGKNGEKRLTFKVTYEDGKETSREVVNETVIKKAHDRVIVQGTYPYMPVSRSGSMMSYAKVYKVKATAYWAVRGVGRTYTASGRKAIWNPDGYSTIAVDPSMIPYGTKLFVEGYGFAVAADTGTGIKGNKIDVYFNTYDDACNWGAKYVKLYVLK